ncbi:WD40 repeat-like protein [Delitschia confertaspora ATCC 74209]|uniref:WD40 repeat-like protein n=1 Tax=Delitschia confertaspora ATCC 74209 TaxID=1513339 RepID=A0A9P4JVY8_9PLEO|nr:WD40 repeat-like protein [Delitschia confertaspora ATCC 74209]
MAPLTQILQSDLGLPPSSYIYKVLSTAAREDPLTYSKLDQLAVISSDDSLRFVDPSSLKLLPNGIIKNVHKSVTCLERVDDEGNIVVTAGRDGLIRFWDKRSKDKVMEIQPRFLPISAIVCNQGRNFVAAGVENPDDGLGDTPVCIWDMRNVQKPQLEFVESHTDTITDLQLHPNLPTLLLSASTDGLINIFDTSKPDEEDALYQVINHRSAVHHAGFLYPGTDIYALGTDETLSFYALQSQEEEKEEPTPNHVGDVREKLGCEYLVKMNWMGSEPYLAAGKHSANRIDLIPIKKSDNFTPLQYQPEIKERIQFPGAHGEEIIRDIFTDVHSKTTYTCGEDGFIRAWRSANAGDAMVTEETSMKKHSSKKKEKRKGDSTDAGGKKARYKPY